MSDNVVDLFAKQDPIQARADKQHQKIKEFVVSIDRPTKPLGSMFATAVQQCQINVHPSWANSLSYGYQIRKPEDILGGYAKVYFTGRSVLKRTIEGRQERPWEIFQVRLEPRLIDAEPREWTHPIGLETRYAQWLEQQGLRYADSVYTAFWLLGRLQSVEENFWITEVRMDSPIFEVRLESTNALARVRIYADALRSDETTLINAKLIPPPESK